ncbi:MAG: hypothetical protein PHQ47_02175 [Candidatus Portnoybacteria bacterium]|nr:hypothetical protein [Candidatus Portnoybacteria bacterium]
MGLQNWADVTISSFQTIWSGFIGFLPDLLGALIVFFIGWAIAVGLEKLVYQILKAIKIDHFLEKMGVGHALEEAGLKLNIASWLGILVKWFLIFVFLLAATDILGLAEISQFLRSVVLYIPNIVVAAIILVAAVWVAGILQRLIVVSISASKIKTAAFVGIIVKWAVYIFGLFAALMQLGIAPALLQTIVTGFIAMLAIAGGLAFGLGGKEQAAKTIASIKEEMED